MKFRPKFRKIELAVPQEIDRIETALQQATLTAASLWLGTVTSIVPVWSGASQATFVKLASAIGFPLPPPRPKDNAPDRYMLGFLTSRGGLVNPAQGILQFEYATDLRYLAFNDQNVAYPGVGGVTSGLIEPTPYQFVLAGQNTFADFAKTVLLPAPVFRGVRL